MNSVTLDLSRSISFDIEEWLESLVASMHTTPEEFARLYVLEVHPVEINLFDMFDLDYANNSYTFKTSQTYKIRRKTDEEMAAEQQTALTQGEN